MFPDRWYRAVIGAVFYYFQPGVGESYEVAFRCSFDIPAAFLFAREAKTSRLNPSRSKKSSEYCPIL